MWSRVFVICMLHALAAAQIVQPAKNSSHSNPQLPNIDPNSPISDNTPVLGIRHGASLFEWFFLLPLTDKAEAEVAINGPILGQLVLNDPSTTNNLGDKDFAVTSCDESDYQRGLIGLNEVVDSALQAKVRAVLFYTFKEDFCNITKLSAFNNYTQLFSIYPQHAAHYAVNISNTRNHRMEKPDGIFTIRGWKAWELKKNSRRNQGGSTAVAMIILYSITGVITALFLIIIITGAIRAHRHPERYGPRSTLGRSRQSRAKGIARAMLDTIPIVKFGDKEAEPNKDVEGHELSNQDQPSQQVNHETTQNSTTAADSSQNAAQNDQASAGATESGSITMAAAIPTTNNNNDSTTTNNNNKSSPSNPEIAHDSTDEALGCSICTDDFEVGQDIRVLPCNHKFHPACVDPWLLEVSGTCPLCRVDLHPPDQQGNDDDTQATDELPPPLDQDDTENAGAPSGSRRRGTLRAFISSRFNRGGLQSTSAEERIEVLRRWREANAYTNPIAAMASPRHHSTTQRSYSTAFADDPVLERSQEEEQQRRNGRLASISRLVRRRDR